MFVLLRPFTLLNLLIDIVCGNVVCDAHEACDKENEICMCGSIESCAGNPAGQYCDASNNVCKCSEDTEACPQGHICRNANCGECILPQKNLLNF